MAADTAAEKRLQRQIDNHRENEARWLQKLSFATGKARNAREKLAEATNEQLNPLITLDNGTRSHSTPLKKSSNSESMI